MSCKERIEIVPLIAVALAVLTAGRLADGITLPFGRLGWPVAAFAMFIPTVTLAVLDQPGKRPRMGAFPRLRDACRS